MKKKFKNSKPGIFFCYENGFIRKRQQLICLFQMYELFFFLVLCFVKFELLRADSFFAIMNSALQKREPDERSNRIHRIRNQISFRRTFQLIRSILEYRNQSWKWNKTVILSSLPDFMVQERPFVLPITVIVQLLTCIVEKLIKDWQKTILLWKQSRYINFIL